MNSYQKPREPFLAEHQVIIIDIIIDFQEKQDFFQKMETDEVPYKQMGIYVIAFTSTQYLRSAHEYVFFL